MKQLLFLCLLTFSVNGFTQTHSTYEYLTMTQRHNDISISKSGKDFEIINVKDEKSKDVNDYRPLLKRIQEFESEGWELFSNQVFNYGDSTVPQNYVMMRRKK